MGINELPAELLLPIFEYASLDDQPDGHPAPSKELDWATQTRRDPSTSVNISQVCARWRNLSLSHQAPWTHLPRSNERLTNCYLSRCPTAPLNVEIRSEHIYSSMKQEQLQTILGVTSRASSLFVSCKPGLQAVDDANALIASRKLPSIRSYLRTLEVLSAPDLMDLRMDLQWEKDVPNIFVEVPRHVFRGQPLEKLRSVQFNYVLLRSPRAFVWPNLRTADFTNSQAWDDAKSFVTFFSGVPLLEEFKSTRYYGGANGGGLPALDTTPVNGLPPLRSVPMANLRKFALHGPYHDILFTLTLLEIPCTTEVSLTLTGRWIAEHGREKLQLMRDGLAAHFAKAVKMNMCFDSVTFDGRRMTAQRKPQSASAVVLPSEFTLSIIPEDDIGDEVLYTIETLCSHPVFARTPSLVLRSTFSEEDRSHDSNRLEPKELQRLLEIYTSFRSITTHGISSTRTFQHAFYENLSGPSSNVAVWRIVGVKFCCDFADRKNGIVVHLLLHALRGVGKQFRGVQLEQCTLGKAERKELSKGLGEGRLLVM